eukprot:GHRR01035279.1.p1 GENE.GHRR01035279.1~~GHRR01035279.1.p1  ORF type:complete len:291 (+),score=93.29 GHRR01035279.1:103-975(+)
MLTEMNMLCWHCSIYKDVVDDLLLEIAVETAAQAAAADAFSFDMLVAAVAFSQGKYDLGLSTIGSQGIGNADLAGVAREAALLQKVAGRGAAVAADAAEAATQGFARGTARLYTNRPVITAGDVKVDMAEEDVYLARRDYTAVDHAFGADAASTALTAAGSTAAGVDNGRLAAQRQVTDRALYLAGLRGMLWEMRHRRPPDTPYGHTQPLTPHFSQGHVSKGHRIAVSRQRPPLAACPSVWARREAAVGRLEPGGWPHASHMAAAARERGFWSLVSGHVAYRVGYTVVRI